MQWSSGDRSNIEDMRGRSGFRAVPIGIGGFLLLLALSWATGTDFLSLLSTQSDPSQTAGTSGQVTATPQEERMVDFVDAVAKDAQDTWSQLLGRRYERTLIVLFRDSIDSACGFAESATGPFYCPRDRKVYLDLGFFDELSRRFGATGDFARAYVLAHELGHHVQHVLGTDARVRQAQEANPSAANELSVRVELQADCYAGVWAHTTDQRQMLQEGDVDEALGAASAVGDDRIQKQTTGRVNVDSFTHGSAAQRSEWFKRGFESGDPRNCNTL